MSSWRDRAQCKDTDTEAFYLGDVGGRSGIDGYRPALPVVTEYCRPCPVKAECLEDAYDTGDWWGIRGGLSGEQRKALKKKWQRANLVARVTSPAQKACDNGTGAPTQTAPGSAANADRRPGPSAATKPTGRTSPQ